MVKDSFANRKIRQGKQKYKDRESIFDSYKRYKLEREMKIVDNRTLEDKIKLNSLISENLPNIEIKEISYE